MIWTPEILLRPEEFNGYIIMDLTILLGQLIITTGKTVALLNWKTLLIRQRQLHKNAVSNLEQVLAATPHKTPTVRPPASYHKNYSS